MILPLFLTILDNTMHEITNFSKEKLLKNLDDIFDYIGFRKRYFLIFHVDILEVVFGEKYINDTYTISFSSCITNIGTFKGIMFRCFYGIISDKFLVFKAISGTNEDIFSSNVLNRYILFLTDDFMEYTKLKFRHDCIRDGKLD